MSDHGSTIAHARLLAGLTLVSRIFGLCREVCFSYFFGASQLLSAFRIAFMIPNLARRLFGEGALSAATIPVLTDRIAQEGDESARRFLGSLLRRLVITLGVIVIVGELIALAWWGFQRDLALKLTIIMLPYLAAICVVAVVGGVLNVRQRFAAPAAAPIILNLSIIVSLIVAAWRFQVEGEPLVLVVCGAVLVGGGLQLLAIGAALRRALFWPIWNGDRSDPGVRSVKTLMAPMILGLSAVQVNALSDHLIAYLFITVDGERVGPAVLGYAQYLYQLPLGVFGIALATAIFPTLAQKGALGDTDGLRAVLVRGLRVSFFLALPASVGLMIVSQPLVAALFQRGATDSAATDRVAGALMFYSAGMAAYFIQHVVVRAYYSLKDSKTPAVVSLWMVTANVVLNVVLVFPLQERGLALSTAVCAFAQSAILLTRLRRRVHGIDVKRLFYSWGRVSIATAIMAAVLGSLLLLPATSDLREMTPVMQLLILIPTGVIAFALAAKALRIEELALLLRRDGGQGQNDE